MCVSAYIFKQIRVGRSLLIFFSKILFTIFPDFDMKHNRRLVYQKLYNEKGSVWARYLSTDEKYDNKNGRK